jgi:hypothetical protein
MGDVVASQTTTLEPDTRSRRFRGPWRHARPCPPNRTPARGGFVVPGAMPGPAQPPPALPHTARPAHLSSPRGHGRPGLQPTYEQASCTRPTQRLGPPATSLDRAGSARGRGTRHVRRQFVFGRHPVRVARRRRLCFVDDGHEGPRHGRLPVRRDPACERLEEHERVSYVVGGGGRRTWRRCRRRRTTHPAATPCTGNEEPARKGRPADPEVEATIGVEPMNKGFADPRVRPLRHVAGYS